MDKWVVYVHTLILDGRKYIGQTNDIKARWKPSAYKTCVKFYNAIQTYGWENFTHKILYSDLTLEEANEIEERLIKEYDTVNNGFNLDSGGLNHLHSQDTKDKMSKTRKGVPKSEEHKKAISEALKRYERTSEHNRNNQLAQHRKEVQCIETGIIYESLADAERKTGILGETISRNCRGKQKSASGYHWRFINGENI